MRGLVSKHKVDGVSEDGIQGWLLVPPNTEGGRRERETEQGLSVALQILALRGNEMPYGPFVI